MFRPGLRAMARAAGQLDVAAAGPGLVHGFAGAIGNTPLIRLKQLSDQTGCEILAKAEFMNPGGSVKDRAALFLVRDAEARGLLRPGGTVVEGTAGNTGIGLAHVCRALGYGLVIFLPDTQAPAKADLLRLLGADVRSVPAVPYNDPGNYNHLARAHAAAAGPNAVWTDQFDNVANRRAHELTTGPEIWAQTGGAVDAFVCATGTGGTLAGVARALRSRRSSVQIYLADPPGSVLFDYVSSRGAAPPGPRGGTSITEGIGQGRVTANLADDVAGLDGALLIPDRDSVTMVYRSLADEGLYLGASSALNLVAARRVAERLGPGHTVVTILCDGAYRYADRLFSRAWLQAKGLLYAVPEELRHLVVLP